MKKHKFKFRSRKDLIKISALKKARPDLILSFDEKEETDFRLENLIKGKLKVLGNQEVLRKQQNALETILHAHKNEKNKDIKNQQLKYQQKVLNRYILELRPIFLDRFSRKVRGREKNIYKTCFFFEKHYCGQTSLSKKNQQLHIDSFICMILVSLLTLFCVKNKEETVQSSKTFARGVQAIYNAIKNDIITKEFLIDTEFKSSGLTLNEYYLKLENKFDSIFGSDTQDTGCFRACCIDILEVICGEAYKNKKTPCILKKPLLQVVIEYRDKRTVKNIRLVNVEFLLDQNLTDQSIRYEYPLIYPRTFDYLIQNQGTLFLGQFKDNRHTENNMVVFHEGKTKKDYPALNLLYKLHETSYQVNIKVLEFIIKYFSELTSSNLLVKKKSEEELKNSNEGMGKTAFGIQELFIKREQQRILERDLLSTALYFSKYFELFFDIRVDKRGRVYFVSSILNLQGTDLSKSLLQFSEAKTVKIKTKSFNEWVLVGLHLLGYKDKVIYDNPNYNVKLLESIFSFSLVNKERLLEFFVQMKFPKFQVLSFYFEFLEYKRAVVKGRSGFSTRLIAGLDATSSSFQIGSALTKDISKLEACNILNKKVYPRDVYLEMVTKFISKHIKDKSFNQRETVYYGEYEKNKTGKSKLVRQRPLPITEEGWLKFQDQCNDEKFQITKLRPAVKPFIMSYGTYGMSVETGYNKIYHNLKNDLSLSSIRYFRSVFYNKVLKIDCAKQKDFSLFLSNLMTEALKQTSFDESPKPFLINISPFFSITILYNEVKKIKTDYRLPYGRRVKVTLKPFKKLDAKKVIPDIPKSSSTFPPNFFHHLDSLILFNLVLDFFHQSSNLSLGTNHDCFYTHVTNFSRLRKAYKKAFNTVLGNPDLIFEKICNDNNLNKEDVLGELQKLYINPKLKLDLSKSEHCISY